MHCFKLDKLYQTAKRVEINEKSTIVFMSDLHRGDGSHADTFLNNKEIYSAALSHYDKKGFTYIELGDGDELWENRKLYNIISAHRDIFWRLSKLHRENRYIMLYGNHDMVKSNPEYVRKHLSYYIDPRTEKPVYLFGDMPIYETLVLRYNDNDILLLHGHQVDLLNCTLWKLARFLVRYLWRPMEAFGVNDPTSAAKNYKRKRDTERKLIHWLNGKNKDLLMIAGHTHRPVLPKPGNTNYFNDGSGVHPRGVTALEIEEGKINLVKWSTQARENGSLYVGRELLAGPEKLTEYFMK